VYRRYLRSRSAAQAAAAADINLGGALSDDLYIRSVYGPDSQRDRHAAADAARIWAPAAQKPDVTFESATDDTTNTKVGAASI
jgi:hypothetical protein